MLSLLLLLLVVPAGSGRTLRETVLESSPVLTLLNQSFISSWALVKELEDLKADVSNPALSSIAALHLDKYTFPVEMVLSLPNGTVIHHINANFFLDQTAMKPEEEDSTMFNFAGGFEDPSTATYIRFLHEGLRGPKTTCCSGEWGRGEIWHGHSTVCPKTQPETNL
ncbi:hypothetical protein COCON_G00001420 [Conger conger]|uniref:Uncharacterized protein n=1 Tax=Conger conger TaxID=82655 RepID=A0A9Q1E0Q9_CONCO|nr:hypothetical protein COCON_G00001420 [Conger conger]